MGGGAVRSVDQAVALPGPRRIPSTFRFGAAGEADSMRWATHFLRSEDLLVHLTQRVLRARASRCDAALAEAALATARQVLASFEEFYEAGFPAPLIRGESASPLRRLQPAGAAPAEAVMTAEEVREGFTLAVGDGLCEEHAHNQASMGLWSPNRVGLD